MGEIYEEQREAVIGSFLERYHLKPNGFLGSIRTYFEYACSSVATGTLLYTDQRYRMLESEIFFRLNELFHDADQSIGAIQFLEDQACSLCRQRKAGHCH